MDSSIKRMVFIFGPTGVGKTDLLVELFAGDREPAAEIISADSMQVYRHMDVGSAKPSNEIRDILPHHLIDIRNPDEQFHAGDFVTLAETVAPGIASNRRIPVVSGGTAFYFRNLLFGLPGTPAGSDEARRRIHDREESEGVDGLYRTLAEVDPATARRISRNDRYRIARALEVYYASGKPLSSFQVPKEPRPDLDVLIIGLERPRDELYRRIEQRVDAMFEAGLCDEVRTLLGMGYGPEDPGFRGIGYREFAGQFSEAGNAGGGKEALSSWVSSLSDTELELLKNAIKQDSRRYAKRQIAFFRQLPGSRWYNPEDQNVVSQAVARFWIEQGR